MQTQEKVFYCFYKVFLKDNSTNKGKCWFFHFLIETDFLDTRSYFLPTNENARLTIIREMSQPDTRLLTNESARTIL